MTSQLPGAARDIRDLRRSFLLAIAFVVLLWLIKLAELVSATVLIEYGVYPRQPGGLAGVLWAPLIHGSLAHLLANTPAVIVLGTALLYSYPRSAGIVVPAVYLGSGLGVWLLGRSAYHVGASGLSFGVMFFVLVIGLLRRDRRAIALSLLVLFLYGGTISQILPASPGISFESHLAGAAIGTGLALLLRNRDPVPAVDRYSWEDEDGRDE